MYPPYLSSKDYIKCQKEIKFFEPKKALLAGVDGLKAYRQVSKIVKKLMNYDTVLLLEIGYNQRFLVSNMFKAIGIKTKNVIKDYQNIDRILVLKKQKSIN